MNNYVTPLISVEVTLKILSPARPYLTVGLAADLCARLKRRVIDSYANFVCLTGRAKVSSVTPSTDQVDHTNSTSPSLIFTFSGIVEEKFVRHSGSVPRSRFLNVATSR
jgi:hypothetical protein